ncbi:SDR family NAD(P)-dependent oxidoreductase [Marinoscillum furvescens]|uniref:NAD(P)-dependent dehydrogenase (Short-subunit alcohol dehydrogenase family) n=1 Tax=Marinoscillum furvescens DSM 4134 TaxID=1122208 RepID=A0A3D9L3I5_MARFU|nr:SDR family NAD(P)-dependent oxidoreductase [Marinoscillum furvescens]RED99803.1 NAD(P)-dependent dehydrogenase (short-subunit alcohol dehydrogenase family) [Marinoscillum furvescens DSM 4134]
MPKNVLVTGATGNLGTAVCKKLLDQGYQVIGTTRPGSQAPESAVDFFPCDLTDENATAALFDQLKSKYQRLDGVICLVGGFGMGNIRESSSQDMLQMLQLNYFTAYHTAQQAINWMNTTGGGKLIFIGAKPAQEGGAGPVLPYAISKSAVAKLAEIINEDADNQNIQASLVVPSIIDTPPNREGMPDANFSDWVTPEALAANIAHLLSEHGSPLRDVVLKVYNRA